MQKLKKLAAPVYTGVTHFGILGVKPERAPSRRTILKRVLAALLVGPSFLRSSDSKGAASPADIGVDPYAHYIRTSSDFQRVKQDRSWINKAFPGWVYMPWTYQWNIGYTDYAGKWSIANGYNGAFLDGNGGEPDTPSGKLAWVNRFGLHFYMDHTARKGYLHLWDGGKQTPHLAELHGNGVRTVPINNALGVKLRGFIDSNISQVLSSPFRSAYALDDETSWGHFVHPTMWKVTDDDAAYPAWLREIYGYSAAPVRSLWISYEDIRPNLPTWTVETFDVSTLLDQWSFNDSYWCNFLGGLVEYANTIDPNTPCGIVGAQSPSPFGGYDYAKLMRKIQYVEAYNLGSSQSIIRSFTPDNAIPAVTTNFHQSSDDDIWQIWYYLAHGNRGHIGWVENWFDGPTQLPWHEQVAPHMLEAGQKIGPLLLGAGWKHDGIGVYYNHASIQLGWIFDSQAHGKTWVNRENDARLGASHMVKKAWENMLRDSGYQYKFVSYVDVIQSGIPADIKTLILPACLCLSDSESHAIMLFCRKGGTVVADYLPGIWDQHGVGRKSGGALDIMFGVRHEPAMSSADLFGGKLWCEVDQDLNYSWKTYEDFLSNGNTCIKDQCGYNKAVRNMPVNNVAQFGTGVAVLLNLSPQWYNAYRAGGFAESKLRTTFMKHIHAATPTRWVEIENAAEPEFGYEITYFQKIDGRTVLFVCLNPETEVSETGGGNAVGLKAGIVPITLKFAQAVRDVRDERRNISLGAGSRFPFNWPRNEAIVLSFVV